MRTHTDCPRILTLALLCSLIALPAGALAQTEASSFTVSSTDVTIAPGTTTGMSRLTVAPSDNLGFNGVVNLTAAITSIPTGAEDPPQVSAPPLVVLAGTDAITTSVSVSTTPATSVALLFPARPETCWYGSGLVLALILLMRVGTPVQSLCRQMSLGLIFVLLLAGGLAACVGGHSGTTPGVYAVTVTGTSDDTTASTVFTITVR
jgi:hypothetical protein